MLTFVLIGAPILFIIASTVGILAFSVSAPAPEAPRAVATKPREELAPVFVHPMPKQLEPMPIDDVVAQLESHLRHEREVAARFASDPSSTTLSLN